MDIEDDVLEQRLKQATSSVTVPLDEEQKAAEAGVVTEAQKNANDVMAKQIAERERALSGSKKS